MMNAGYVLILLGLILSLFLPIAALFGFYDNRGDDSYRFRSLRFLIIAVLLVFIPICAAYTLTIAVGTIAKGSMPIAEKATANARAQQIHIQDNLAAVFPDILNDATQACYVAGISSYVQDQWAQIYRQKTCAMGQNLCADNEQEFFDKDRDQRNPTHFPLIDFDPMDDMFGSIWATASDIYKLVRSYQGIIDPISLNPPRLDTDAVRRGMDSYIVGTDAHNYEIYHQYLTNCANLKPAFWIVPDAPLVTSPTTLCMGDCP